MYFLQTMYKNNKFIGLVIWSSLIIIGCGEGAEIMPKNPNIISDFTTYFINGSYVFRMILIYIEFLWIILVGIVLIIKYIRKRKFNSKNAS